MGRILCECCKKYLLNKHVRKCLKCDEFLDVDYCPTCATLPCSQFWIGERKDDLKDLINLYKYKSVRACGDVLAEMMAECIDLDNAVIVPLPTISKHIRDRGFDHTSLLARKIAKIKGWKCESVLLRVNNTVQVGSSAEKRQRQAREAYMVRGSLNAEKLYLLLDDVWTSGSSMMAAYEKIFQAGARKIAIAVLAKSG